ncbi:hypothetical protein [Rhizobium laguerreae]|uniref:hypothetical protein n=1 Tax=Rhizobium laguerreae TaxID=1076926 RepID=UPI00103DC4DC|nr:hypothetical protein [Rhizobium laguerreae]TBY04242.1 hypothetical protein E0I94_26180 [Rhizobium laguerreae]
MGKILSLIGVLLISAIGGLAAAIAVLATVPAIADNCNEGIVCRIVSSASVTWFDHGPIIPTSNKSCISARDAQKILGLGRLLVESNDSNTVDFGKDACIPLPTVLDQVCKALEEDVAGPQACSKFNSSG